MSQDKPVLSREDVERLRSAVSYSTYMSPMEWNALCDLALSGLDRPGSGWISVEERLPEDGLLCAVVDNGLITIGKRYSRERTERKQVVRCGGWMLGEELESGFGMADVYRDTITYWMPLPLAPPASAQTREQEDK